MAYRQDNLDELLALKQEAAHLLGSCNEEWRTASNQKIKEIVADTKAVVSEIADAIAREEEDIGRALEGKVAAALTTALMVGIVIGWAWRKKS